MSVQADSDAWISFIQGCSEDYLIRHANKGLYKRACKELEQGIVVTFLSSSDALAKECELPDGTRCSLTTDPSTWRCSCPAGTICKHMLIAVMAYQRSLAAPSGGGEAEIVRPSGKEAPLPAQEMKIVQPSGKEASLPAQEMEIVPTSGREASLPAQGIEIIPTSVGEVPQPAERFVWMLQSDLRPLLKGFRPVTVEEASFRLRHHQQPIEVVVDTLLTIVMRWSEAEVSFSVDPLPIQAICKSSATHQSEELLKLEALLRYRMQAGCDDSEALAKRLNEAAPVSMETIAACRTLLEDILHRGIARLPDTYAARIETMAVAAHSADLPEVETALRGIHGELQYYWSRHIRFSARVLLQRISKLLLRLTLLASPDLPALKKNKLVGKFRSRYYALPRLRLYGLGAEPWETRSGYRGITCYMYDLNNGGLYTFSALRPLHVEDITFSYSRQYAGATPWSAMLSLQDFAGSQLEFRQIKVNEEGRLSAGDGARLQLEERQSIEDCMPVGEGMLSLQNADTSQIGLFEESQSPLVLLKLLRLERPEFDQLQQRLLIRGYDLEEQPVDLWILYQADFEPFFRRFERGFGLQIIPEQSIHILARAASFGWEAISMLQGKRVHSFKLDTANV